MLFRTNRRASGMLRTVLILGLLFQLFPLSIAGAQPATQPSGPSVQDLFRDIETLKEEVRYLRRQQASHDSAVERLPVVSVSSLLEQNAANDPSLTTPQNSDCAAMSCGGHCGCNCPCEYPLPEAPCIECPRVSTLNPNYNVNIFGALVGDMLFNEARPISPGAPYYLTPASPTGRDQNTVDIHGRSSYLTAALTGPQMGNFRASGMAMVFFYNDNVLADQYGVLPAQVWGDLKNEDWRFAAGLLFDVFNPGAPTMLAFSALAGSGNSGNAWRGQIRVERFIKPSEGVQWTIQGALSEPIASVITPDFRQLSEDNGWPNVEGRIALGLGLLDAAGLKRPFEVGFSGVVGELRSTPLAGNRVVTGVWGAGVDFRWQMTECIGFGGEAYTGKALGTYNGGILQNVNAATMEGIRSSGGWGEVFVYWTPRLHSHLGYGIDDPQNEDLSVNPADFQRERNETIFGNLIWDLNQSFRLGFEMTYRETENTSVLDNEGAGFHTQFRWSF